ncbi:MAG: hypothetical protein PVI57_03690 [Gemmatimonadota bacterium]
MTTVAAFVVLAVLAGIAAWLAATRPPWPPRSDGNEGEGDGTPGPPSDR